MTRFFQRWWPALPASLILYLGMASFAREFPRGQNRRAATQGNAGRPDTLLAFVRAAEDSAPRDSAPEPSPEANPFRPVRPVEPVVQGGAHLRRDPPVRGYILRGTVGSDVATITNRAGQKVIVKVGDRVDSAEVLAIEPNRVLLKDRAGKFEILLNQ